MRLNNQSLHLGFAMCLALVASDITLAQQATSVPKSSEASCTEIAVSGAVRNPVHFEARSRIRIVDVLTHAGGPTERAGKTIRVIHSCKCGRCGDSDMKADWIDEYNLAEVTRDKTKTPYVFPGDLVFVLESELVYVLGGMRELTFIIWREGLSVTKAIALSGGARNKGNPTTIRVHRVSKNAYQDPIVLDLKAINEGRAEDVLLQPRDIVAVSDWQGSSLFSPMGHPQIIRDPPLIPRDYRVICNMSRFKDLKNQVCRLNP